MILLLIAAPATLPAEESAPAAPVELGESPILSIGPVEYRPGRGAQIGATGLVVGGFTNAKVEDAEDSGAEFALDSLNVFFIFDRFPRFRFVAELEMKDIFVTNGEHTGAQDFAFDVRRLFGDFSITDELRVRAGTFLTPVGYWNLILAPPLTWTTEPPVIVEETFFQQTTTGVMLHGSTEAGSGQLNYSLFSQFLKPIAEDPDLRPPNYTAGARLTYDFSPASTVGATYQGADINGGWTHLGAFHALWEHERGQILSELYVQDGDALPSAQWGTYIQGVLEVYGPFYVVGRYEHFDPPTPEPTVNLFTIGSVWKPFPFMAVKVEYRFADHNFDPDDGLEGFFSSFTTFF